MKKTLAVLLSDAYKQSHVKQYPEGTEIVYSNWTPRTNKRAKTTGGVVVWGIQAFFIKLNAWFDEDFFEMPLEEVVDTFTKTYKAYFGEEPDVTHIVALHELGYLPIDVKALNEGTICPIGVPMLTIFNTHKDFAWVVGFLETIMSTELWMPMTSATIAKEYHKILTKWSERTCDTNDHVQFQAHDFSMRGMAGLEAATASGAAHLTSFVGSDTIPAVDYLENYYNAEPAKELVACSIPATEHSVMSMGTKDDEIGTFKRLITEIYPHGFISIVSDTWNLWTVLDVYLPALKEEIMARKGKVVIRPDSGDPVEIICGSRANEWIPLNVQRWGVIESLWHFFGGTVNDKGYKVLDPHIGAIYGDAINLERADEICRRLEAKGFASSNIVFGVGSFTYQFNTRDVYGFAMKATYGEVNGEAREIFKDPITDSGMKRSLKGLIQVKKVNGSLVAIDQVGWKEEVEGELHLKYYDGDIFNVVSLEQVRERLNSYYESI